MQEPEVFVFWDISNIYISGQQVADRKEGFFACQTFRIQFDRLYQLAHANRPIGKTIAVGSIQLEMQTVWERFEQATGVKAILHERGAQSGKEQAEDAVLQVEMLRTLWDQRRNPQVAVLLTGDGRGYEDGVGFHADLERMADGGWGIEVLSWEHSCNRNLRHWAEKVGVFLPLDKYYESISFLENRRLVKALNLTRRPMAYPKEGLTVAVPPPPKPDPAADLTPEQKREMEKQQKRERGKRKHERRLKALKGKKGK